MDCEKEKQMDTTFIITDVILAMAVIVFAMVAIRQNKATKETEIKSALAYLTIVLMLVIPLLVSQCTSTY